MPSKKVIENRDQFIKEFDDFEVNDLLSQPAKSIQVATYIKIKELNGTVARNCDDIKELKGFNRWLIRGVIGTIGIGVLAAIIIYIVQGLV